VVLTISGFVAWSSLKASSPVSAGGKQQSSAPAPAVAVSDTLPPVRVAVLNGCGRPGIASVFVQKLRKDGMDVVNGLGGNADSFEFDRSVVVDRRGNRKNAEAVAGSLGISLILDQRSESPYLMEDVVVVIGRDWDTLLFPRKEIPD
jgi:hypothetical protein